MSKPCATGRIVRWFVILLEFSFKVAVKKGTMHQRADHLSQITLGEPPKVIHDDFPNTTLFQLEWAPQWSEIICEFLTTGSLNHLSTNKKKRDLIYQSASFHLIAGRL